MEIQRTGAGVTLPGERGPATPSNAMGKQEFLKLLITQLRYQDPLRPTQDQEFVAQLAQFSSLEEIQNVARFSSLQSGLGLLGRQVVAKREDGQSVTGTVQGLRQSEAGVTMVSIQTGADPGAVVEVELEQVQQVNVL